MALVVPNVGENKLLSFALGDASPADQTLKLYVNDYTPVAGSVAGDFTEMSTLGYSAKTLTMASWTIAQNGSAEAEATYAQQTWTFTAGSAVTVYGYYVVDSGSGVLLWAERFSSPPTVQNSGDIIRVTPVLTASD